MFLSSSFRSFPLYHLLLITLLWTLPSLSGHCAHVTNTNDQTQTNIQQGDGILYVITPVFHTTKNDLIYTRRIALYRAFAERFQSREVQDAGVRLVTVECIFPQLGQAEFLVTQADNPLHFQLTSDTIYWVQEGLINYAVRRLPPSAQNIAWIEPEVSFHGDAIEWIERTREALGIYAAVQMFQMAHEIDPSAQGEGVDVPSVKSLSVGFAFSRSPLCDLQKYVKSISHGLAWAMRRSVFQAMGGLPDFYVMGGAPAEFARAVVGSLTTDPEASPESVKGGFESCRLRKQDQIRSALLQARATHGFPGGMIGYVRANISYAGSLLDSDHVQHSQFDPQRDLTGFANSRPGCPGSPEQMGKELRQLHMGTPPPPRTSHSSQRSAAERLATVRFMRGTQMQRDFVAFFEKRENELQNPSPESTEDEDAVQSSEQGTPVIDAPTPPTTAGDTPATPNTASSSKCPGASDCSGVELEDLDTCEEASTLSNGVSERDPLTTPPRSLTMLVFSSDEKFFPLLKGLVLSLIQPGVLTSTMQLAFIDIGCSASSLRWLRERNVWIRRVDKEIMGALADPRFGYQLAQTSRPFLPRLWPQGDKFIWLDTDVWVQDVSFPSMLEQAMSAPEFENSALIVPEIHFTYTLSESHDPATRFTELFSFYSLLYNTESASKLSSLPILNSGLFAMRAESTVWNEWSTELARVMFGPPGGARETSLEARTQPTPPLAPWLRPIGSDRVVLRVAHMAEQLALNMVLRRSDSARLSLIDPLFNYVCLWTPPRRGLPGETQKTKSNDSPETSESLPVRLRHLPYTPLGVVHLAAWHYFGPMYIEYGLLYDEGRYLTDADWEVLDTTHSKPVPR